MNVGVQKRKKNGECTCRHAGCGAVYGCATDGGSGEEGKSCAALRLGCVECLGGVQEGCDGGMYGNGV